MKVFLSWSGQRSKEVAEALRDWLPYVLHSVNPFMSSVNIETGQDFFKVLRSELKESNFGILCLTKDNIRSPWVLFESGALAKVLENSALCPYLIDMAPQDLPGPLRFFHAASADEKGTRELVRSLNAASDLVRLADPHLHKSFDRWWPDLKPKLESKAQPLGPSVDAQAFYLINVKAASYVRASGLPRKNGEPLDLAAVGDEREIWRFHPVERKYFAIVSAYTEQCVDVEGNSTAERAKVHQWQFQNGENQKWCLLLQPDGSYKLRVKHSRYFLAVTDAGIKQMPEVDSRSQKWWLIPVFNY